MELGLGVITGSINDIRTDVSDLQQKHPQLAEEFILLRNQIDAAAVLLRSADKRYKPAEKLEQLIGLYGNCQVLNDSS